jgi:hypothetical protein
MHLEIQLKEYPTINSWEKETIKLKGDHMFG